jgi:small subunit ribosomal protein S17
MADKDEQNEIEETAAEATEPAEAPLEAEAPVEAEAAADVAEEVAARVPEDEPAEGSALREGRQREQTKKSKKRVPRALRPQRTRTRAAKQPGGARKPLSREPKPEHERGARQERRGVVVSSGMDKTIVVRVEIVKMHPRYKKVIRRSTKFHAHDERNEAHVGDIVRIVETRPLSRTKRWRLAEVVEAAR